MKVVLILLMLFILASRLKRWIRKKLRQQTMPQQVIRTVRPEPLTALEHQDNQQSS